MCSRRHDPALASARARKARSHTGWCSRQPCHPCHEARLEVDELRVQTLTDTHQRCSDPMQHVHLAWPLIAWGGTILSPTGQSSSGLQPCVKPPSLQ